MNIAVPSNSCVMQLASLSFFVGACILVRAAFAQPITTTEFAVPAPVRALTAGTDGNIWFTDVNGAVGRINMAGAVSLYIQFAPGTFLPNIAAGPDGNMWVTEWDQNKIARVTPSGVVTEFGSGIAPGGWPYGITSGPDGNLWFTEPYANRIANISTSGLVTDFVVPGPPTEFPWNIVPGPDGNLWFTEGQGGIGRITPSGMIPQYALGSAFDGIVVGPDGNLWFTRFSNVNQIGRITVAGAVDQYTIPQRGLVAPVPGGIAVWNSRVWFTETDDRLATITTDGIVTEYTAGISAGAVPTRAAIGPDGNLWFAQLGRSAIGRASAGLSVTPPAAVPVLHPWCLGILGSLVALLGALIRSRREQ